MQCPSDSAVPMGRREPLSFCFQDQEWRLGAKALLMGIVNVTPDSFSDGGEFLASETAVAHGEALVRAGAALLDIGGESTRPGAPAVSAAEELARVLPVIRGLRERVAVPLSIDTSKATVAEAAVAAGAAIVNDISGLHHDPAMLDVVRRTGAGGILMHMRGTPATMQQFTEYADLIGEIAGYFRDTLRTAQAAGVPQTRFLLDPGIGFSKTPEQNLALIRNLWRFRELGRPVLAGPSRKSFIGKLLPPGLTPHERVWGTAGAVAACVLCGADIVRVHDVAEMAQVLAVADAVRGVSMNGGR